MNRETEIEPRKRLAFPPFTAGQASVGFLRDFKYLESGGFMKTTDDIVRIVSFGGGVIIDASKTTDDLVRIASFASGKGSRVIIKEAGRKTTDDLVRIASFGNGAVIFDLTD